jgi:hypothetical protein
VDGQTEGITCEMKETDRQFQIDQNDKTQTTEVETDSIEEVSECQVVTYKNQDKPRVVPYAPLFGTLPWTYDIEDNHHKEATVQSPYEMYEWTSTVEKTSHSQEPTGMAMVEQWLIQPTDPSKLELKTSGSMDEHLEPAQTEAETLYLPWTEGSQDGHHVRLVDGNSCSSGNGQRHKRPTKQEYQNNHSANTGVFDEITNAFTGPPERKLDPGGVIWTIDGRVQRMVGETGESLHEQMTCQFSPPELILNGPPVNRIVKEMIRARPSEKPPWENIG